MVCNLSASDSITYGKVNDSTLCECVAALHAATLAVLHSGIDCFRGVAATAVVGSIINNVTVEFVVSSSDGLLR